MNGSSGISLREVPAPLRMTTWIGWWTGEGARLFMNGSSGISLREVPAPLKMTTWIGWRTGEGARLSTDGLSTCTTVPVWTA